MRDGYLVKKNILPKADLAAVKQELLSFKGETREAWQGDTITRRSVLEPDALTHMPLLKSMLRSTTFQRLSSYTGAILERLYSISKTVKNQFVEDNLEGKRITTRPPKILSCGYFSPTMKLWFFMNEVKAEHGPFTYIPGSQKTDMGTN